MSSQPNAGPANGCAYFPGIIPGTSQTVPIQVSNNQSNAFAAGSSVIHVVATAACVVAFGSNPNGGSGGMYLVPNIPYFLGVTPGQKLGVIRTAGDGTLYVTEGA